MSRRTAALVAVAMLGLWGAMQRPSAVERAPGVIAPNAPVQNPLAAPAFERGGYRYQPFATFALEARVLGVERYSLDHGAEVAPIDIAFGWGRMSDTRVLQRLSITQSNRWYHWRYSGHPPIPPDEIYRSSANMHLIPANDAVEATLKRARTGDVLALRGSLVDVRKNDGTFVWNSSRSREDRGDGACELIYVEAVSLR